MKALLIVLLASPLLAGCVAVAEPPHASVYVAPAYGYYSYHGPRHHPYYRHRHYHQDRW